MPQSLQKVEQARQVGSRCAELILGCAHGQHGADVVRLQRNPALQDKKTRDAHKNIGIGFNSSSASALCNQPCCTGIS